LIPDQEIKNRGGGGIAFIGAMNIDCIVHKIERAELSQIAAQIGSKRLVSFAETVVSDEEMRVLLDNLDGLDYRFQLGGSAFSAVRAANLVQDQIRLGFVGVSGKFGGNYPHLEFFNQHGIESGFVEATEKPPATSLSFVYGGDRTLVTSLGASAEVADLLEKRGAEVARYLATFDSVHVTSFIDNRTVEKLAETLELARQISPSVQISVDPGAIWTSNKVRPAQRVFREADVLFLGEAEFSELGGKLKHEAELDCASRIFRLMRQSLQGVIVLRKPRSSKIFVQGPQKLSEHSIQNSNQISSSDIFDPTGAGDTFSGVFLALLASRTFWMSIASAASMVAATEKVQHFGEVAPEDLVRGLRKISMADLELDKLVKRYDD
jgi:sugar/nucleoside kinase (ribokinase family)